MAVCYIFITLLLLRASIAPLWAQPPSEIPITGVTAFPVDLLRSIVRTRSADSARADIVRIYTAQGFLDAVVEIDSAQGVNVREGSRYTIGSFSVAPAIDGIAGAEEMVGAPFVPESVWMATVAIAGRLEKMGYPLAKISTSLKIRPDTPVVDISLAIDSGHRVVIQGIEVQGNTSTRHDFIEAAALIPPGSLFTTELALAVRRRLERLAIFANVEMPGLYRNDSGEYRMLITVEEGNPNTFDGVIGYQPADSLSPSGTLTGMINVSLRNLFGSGRRLAFRWQQQASVGADLEIRYGEPLLFGLPLDIEIGFHQSILDESSIRISYVDRTLEGSIGYGLSDAFQIRAGGRIIWTIPQNDTSIPCDRQVLRGRLFEGSLGLVYDTRSNRFNPSSGMYHRSTLAIGSRRINGPFPCDTLFRGDASRRRGEVLLEGYVPLAGPLVAYGDAAYAEVVANVLEETDLFAFGGEGSVRGYRQGQFRGARVASGTLELRLLLSELSHVAVFGDIGYYSRPVDPLRANIPSAEEIIYGYGVGAQIETPLGLVRLSFALGKDDSFATGKVYVGLVNQF